MKNTYEFQGVEYLLGSAGSLILACPKCGEEHFRKPENYFWSLVPENKAWIERGQENYWGDPSWHKCMMCKTQMEAIRMDELESRWKPFWQRLGEEISGASAGMISWASVPRKGSEMRMQTRVTVFDQEQYEDEWPPTDATECVAWFSRKLETIPAEYRATAKIEIESVRSYEDSCYAHIVIYYYRPETDDEMAAREGEEHRRQEALKANELRKLAELKAKYGS